MELNEQTKIVALEIENVKRIQALALELPLTV